jgi:hypothetical protein
MASWLLNAMGNVRSLRSQTILNDVDFEERTSYDGDLILDSPAHQLVYFPNRMRDIPTAQ